jgi:hypothetical protein
MAAIFLIKILVKKSSKLSYFSAKILFFSIRILLLYSVNQLQTLSVCVPYASFLIYKIKKKKKRKYLF